MGRRVFISYSRADAEFVKTLAGHLRTGGVPVWWDREIAQGDRWSKAIKEAIEDSAAVVVVVTEAAQNSGWVEREVLLTQKRRKVILPLLRSGSRWWLLGDRQETDVRGGGLPGPEFVARLLGLCEVDEPPAATGEWRIVGAGGADAREYFKLRARGHPSHSYGADLFRGRSAAMRAVGDWFAQKQAPGRPLVITGQPGAGKSAVLARAVLDQEAGDLRPGVAIRATDATLADIIGAVARASGMSATPSIERLLEWIDAEHDADDPLAVAIDAVDEMGTSDERRRTAEFLVTLSRLPQIRLVVATRPLADTNHFAPGRLLPTLGVTRRENRHLVDLDSEQYFAEADLRDFVGALLTQDGARHPAPAQAAWAGYRTVPSVTARLAEVVSRQAGRNYLIAALTASRLAAEEEIVDPDAADFDLTQIPTTVGVAVTSYLKGLPDAPILHGVLTSLAYARGEGIGDRRWLSFAAALGYAASQVHLDLLRRSAAADYLIQSAGSDGADSGGVSRLFHRALAEQLVAGRSDPGHDELRLLETLLPAEPGGWTSADSYTRAHVAEHASAAGRLDNLLDDVSFLAVAEVDRLIPLLPTRPSAAVAPMVAIFLRAVHRVRLISGSRRLHLLALTAAHLGFFDLQRRIQELSGTNTAVRWAHDLGTPHQKIGTHQYGTNALAMGRVGDREVIVSGGGPGGGGKVRIWDADGQPITPLLGGHSDWVTAVAVGRLDGSDVIVTCGGDTVLRRGIDGEILGPELPVGSTAMAMAVGRLGDRDVTVIGHGTFMGEVLVRDGRGVKISGITHGSPVNAVAAGRLGDRDVIVSAGHNGVIRTWDSGGRPVGPPMTGHSGRVNAVAIGRLGDSSVIVSGGEDGTVRIWDTECHAVGTPLTGHSGAVLSIAMANFGETQAIISGGIDGSVRLWSGNGPVGPPLIGHTGRVFAVAGGTLRGRDVVVSGDGDGSIRLWRIEDRAAGRPLIGHGALVRALCVGLLGNDQVLVSGGADGAVKLWDTQGRSIGEPLLRHSELVSCVVLGRFDDQRVIVSAGHDGKICVWGADRHRLGEIYVGAYTFVRSVAIGQFDGRTVIVSSESAESRYGQIFSSEFRPIGPPLKGHDGMVGAVAVGHIDGEDVIVTGRGGHLVGQDRAPDMLRIRHAGGDLQGSPIAADVGWVPALAIGSLGGRDVIVSGNGDGTIWIWDSRGRPVGEPLSGHDDMVTGIAMGVVAGRDVIVSGGIDSTVRIWDPASGIATVLDVLEPVHGVGIDASGRIYAANAMAICSWTVELKI